MWDLGRKESFGETLGLSSPNSNSNKKEKKSILAAWSRKSWTPVDCPTRRLDQFSADPRPAAISVRVLPRVAGADHATRLGQVSFVYQ